MKQIQATPGWKDRELAIYELGRRVGREIMGDVENYYGGQYAQSIDSAMLVADHLRLNLGWQFFMGRQSRGREWAVMFLNRDHIARCVSDNLAEAICLAALDAVQLEAQPCQTK
jgi:hypothetical protein